MTKGLRAFVPDLIRYGMQYDEGGLAHTHTKVDASALRPPFKFHLCTSKLRPEGRMEQKHIDAIGRFMLRRAKNMGLDIKAIASVPRVGNAIAESFVLAKMVDGVTLPWLKFSKHDDGTIGPVAHDAGYPRGEPVWLIDDVVHGGISKMRMLEQVWTGGWRVAGILVFLDYDQGARKDFDWLGIPLVAVTTVRRVIQYGRDDGVLSQERYIEIRRYLDATRKS